MFLPHQIADLDKLAEAGYTESTQWVQLSSIFGAAAVSKETAEIISSAVKKWQRND